MDGLKSKEKVTLPVKLVSKPSRGKTKVNFTVNVQSLVTFGIKNLLCLDNNFESDSNSARDEYAKVFLIEIDENSSNAPKDHMM